MLNRKSERFIEVFLSAGQVGFCALCLLVVALILWPFVLIGLVAKAVGEKYGLDF